MTTDTKEPGKSLIGKQVLYVDMMKLQHHGTIVKEDDEWLYVFSSSPGAPQDSEYHFRVKRAVYDAIKFEE